MKFFLGDFSLLIGENSVAYFIVVNVFQDIVSCICSIIFRPHQLLDNVSSLICLTFPKLNLG